MWSVFGRTVLKFHPAVVATLAVVAAGSSEGRADQPRPELGFCRAGVNGACQCSFSSIENAMTFPEAANVILFNYRNFPDEDYEGLLGKFMRQCAGLSLSAAWRPASKQEQPQTPAVKSRSEDAAGESR